MNNRIYVAAQGALLGIFGLLLTDSEALASGFSVPEFSALGMGTANAVVANPVDPGAFAYNPAAMGFHDGSSIALGALLLNPKYKVTTGSGSHDSQNADWFAAPAAQMALKVHDRWRLGFGVTAPFGLETRWTLGTFPKLSGTLSLPTGLSPPYPASISVPTGNHPTTSSLEIVGLTPTLTYKVNEDFAVAVGIDYYNARKIKLSSQITTIEGDGDAWGWNASLLYRRNALSVGASFHSAATLDIDGSYKPLDDSLVKFGVLKPKQGMSVDLYLPWRLQLGIRYAISDQLAVELDWTRTGWSLFDQLEVNGSDDGRLFSDRNDWRDANAYRLGLTYDIRPTTQLRLGYSYDQTGQDDAHFNARVPDSDRHLFAIGIGQDLGQGWALEAAYMYAVGEERTIRSSTPYRKPGDEVNGSDAYDGTYNSSVNLLALEVRKSF